MDYRQDVSPSLPESLSATLVVAFVVVVNYFFPVLFGLELAMCLSGSSAANNGESERPTKTVN